MSAPIPLPTAYRLDEEFVVNPDARLKAAERLRDTELGDACRIPDPFLLDNAVVAIVGYHFAPSAVEDGNDEEHARQPDPSASADGNAPEADPEPQSCDEPDDPDAFLGPGFSVEVIEPEPECSAQGEVGEVVSVGDWQGESAEVTNWQGESAEVADWEGDTAEVADWEGDTGDDAADCEGDTGDDAALQAATPGGVSTEPNANTGAAGDVEGTSPFQPMVGWPAELMPAELPWPSVDS